ncbi:MAG TPA: hypothetical protein PLF13_06660 [candidate division Zixibacteria bacterium]|nr:hypothetical protein [candidate division Zixibacteria bacterium]
MRFFVSIAIIFAITTNVAASDPPAYQPYGFQMPFLSARQFVCALSYTQNDTETHLNRSDPDTNQEYDYSLGYFLFDGALALTDKFLVGTKLWFYPGQTYQKYYYRDYYQRTQTDLNATMAPEITIAFRPQPGLEISGSYLYEIHKLDYIYPEDTEFQSSYQIGQKQTTHEFRIGITYFGSL